jgi:hypothetical protein
MTLEVDFVPFATGAGANVTAQSTYIAESTTSGGFVSGVAPSADCNKAWRQGTVMAAALANFIANALSENVLDNGSLSTLITQLTSAVQTVASAEATTVVDSALSSLTLPFTSVTGSASNGQIPQSAVTQYQSQLQIAFTQLLGAAANGQIPQSAVTQYQAALSIAGTQITGIAALLEAMMISGAVTLEADPGGTPANGTPGSIIAYY